MMTRSNPARSATGAQTVLEARLARMENKLDTLIELDEERRWGAGRLQPRGRALADMKPACAPQTNTRCAQNPVSMRQAGRPPDLLAAAVAAWLATR